MVRISGVTLKDDKQIETALTYIYGIGRSSARKILQEAKVERYKRVKDLKPEDKELAGHLILTAKKIAEEKGLSGYKLIFNVGKDGGQIIGHLHLHLVAGKITDLP